MQITACCKKGKPLDVIKIILNTIFFTLLSPPLGRLAHA